jgi:hypothetical protein
MGVLSLRIAVVGVVLCGAPTHAAENGVARERPPSKGANRDRGPKKASTLPKKANADFTKLKKKTQSIFLASNSANCKLPGALY